MSILRNTLKRNFTKPVNLLFMFAVPILLNVMMILPGNSAGSYKIAIVDADNTKYTNIIIEVLEKDCKIIEVESQEDARKLVINNKVDCALVIDSGFTDALIKGEEPTISSMEVSGSNVLIPIQTKIKSEINAANQIACSVNYNEDKFYDALDDYHDGEYSAEYKNFASVDIKKVNNGVKSIGYLAFSMLFLISFSIGTILEDKKIGVYDRLAASPISRTNYYIQQATACFIITAIQSYLVLEYIPDYLDVSYGATINQELQVLVLCCVFGAVCVAIGMFICRISRSILMADSLIMIINFPMIMVSGCLWPREIMPEAMQKIGDFLPTTWFLDASKKVIEGMSLVSVRREIFYMLGVSVVLMAVASFINTDKA